MASALIDSGEKREGLPEFNEELPCPWCNQLKYIKVGYGLAGGGCGPYTFCEYCETIVTKSDEGEDE